MAASYKRELPPDVEDRLREVLETERRGLFRQTVEICASLAIAGCAPALLILARRLDNDSRNDETADACIRKAAELGHPEAMFVLGQRLEMQQRKEEGLLWIRRAAEQGYPMAMGNLGSKLKRAGQVEEADQWHERRAGLGDPVGMYLRGTNLAKEGDPRAEAWLLKASDAGHGLAMRALYDLWRGTGRSEEATGWLEQLAESQPAACVAFSVTHPDHAKSRALLERAAKAGNTSAMQLLAERLYAEGRATEAEAWLHQAIDGGDTWAFREILERHADEVERGERVEYFLGLASACQYDGLFSLADRFEDAGHADEVMTFFRRRAEAGGADEEARWAQQLWRAGKLEESESCWRRAIESGAAEYAIRRLGELLDETGRREEANALRRWGIEPGGATGRFEIPAVLTTFLQAVGA